MMVELIKLLPPQESRNGGTFIRVEFKSQDGKFYKMDLVLGFRNFQRWKKWLKVGNRFGNVFLRDKETIDADSWFIRIDAKKAREIEASKSPDTLKKMSEMGIFG